MTTFNIGIKCGCQAFLKRISEGCRVVQLKYLQCQGTQQSSLTLKRYAKRIAQKRRCHAFTVAPAPSPHPLLPGFGLVLLVVRSHVEAQSIRIKIQLVLPTSFLQDSGYVSSILNLPEIHVASALLDRVSNELG